MPTPQVPVAAGLPFLVEGERRERRFFEARPVGNLAQQRPGIGVLAERSGPTQVGIGLGWQPEGLAFLPLAEESLEILEDDSPGDAVHQQVMGDEGEGVALAALEERQPGQWTALQVELPLQGLQLAIEPGRLRGEASDSR